MEQSQRHLPMPDKPAFLPEPFEWIYIPAGEVTTDNWIVIPGHGLKKQQKVEQLEPFYIAKYPITNAQFEVYVQETGQAPKTSLWQDEPFKNQKGSVRETRFNLPLQPVIDLRWYEAMWFCRWLTSKMDYLITLPTEGEWVRAAQGDDNRIFPWGNDWDSSRCNTEENRIWQTTPVTQYPEGASPYGVMDMIGNIEEWSLTDFKTGANSLDIPEIRRDFDWDFETQRVFKGGSCGSSKVSARIQKQGASPINLSYMTGIRLVARVNGWHG